jgi:hypothetical protein
VLVNEMALLLGLLVVSYVGSLLLSSGTRGGFGSPAGSQWLVLGFVLGPHVLAVAPRGAITSFGPLALVATAWVALVLGTEYGHSGNRRLSPRAFVVGLITALISASLIGGAVYAVALWIVRMSEPDARVIAIGLGLAGSETARHAVRWVVEQGAVRGALLTLLEEISETDEVVPMLGLAFLFAGVPSDVALVPITFGGWLAVTLLLGLVLGLTATLLLAGLTAAAEAWSVLLGAVLLGTGIAWRLSISPLSALFVMGICISLASRHASELRPLLARTEAAVLLPTLLLAGASLRFEASAGLWWILGVTLLARTLVRGCIGYTLAFATGARPAQRLPLGLGMSCTGAATLLVGLTFAFRFPGSIGNLVLTVAACSAVVGDLLGPAGLRYALLPASEVAEQEVAPSTP